MNRALRILTYLDFIFISFHFFLYFYRLFSFIFHIYLIDWSLIFITLLEKRQFLCECISKERNYKFTEGMVEHNITLLKHRTTII